jgi:ketopantoate reductase
MQAFGTSVAALLNNRRNLAGCGTVSETNSAWRPSLLQDLDAGTPLELDAGRGGAAKIG